MSRIHALILTGVLLLAAGAAAQTAPPVLDPIGAQSVNENVSLNFGVSASDADATIPVLSTSALPTGATFTDNLDGTGSFAWTPDFTQASEYSVTFYAADAVTADIDSEIVSITVNNVNQEPVLAAIGPRSVAENANLNFGVSASDADGQALTLTTSTLPLGATFTDNGNGTGTLDWTPDFTQSGVHNVTFRASDGTAIDSEIVAITVTNVNQEPVLAAIGPRGVAENANLNFGVSASDADGQALTLTTSTLPLGATFTDNGNGTGTFDWTPDYTQSGVYNVTFRASDGTAIDSEIVAITVTNVNQEPVLAAIGPKSVAENANLNFGVSASDADGQAL
ncbi:MAG: Ig-like domain-containing protein, partial [candidate division Zixibacteria bacterium]|nr:Ig-like domain-containing protein [candidate division Zixibacteria bacterium]